MTQMLHSGDLLANDSILIGIEEGEYLISNMMDGNIVRYERINGYKEHDTILAHPSSLFCIHCGEQVGTSAEDYPYVKMLHELSDECNVIERFK